ncbi:MAG: hypothetical protein SPK04_02835 [Succinivibrionaceae bacterium]|nr:hypothetical protein [Succinivibrionaceae bacterium]
MDLESAAGFYQKACDLNNAAGCEKLANLTMEGYGATQDQKKALELYNKACSFGSEEACQYIKENTNK